jgi:YD repeat-containing protein
VTYTYDAAGRLSRKDNGNGTYATYEYDPNGNVLHLVNYAPGGAVNSRFDYTYNVLGQRVTMATLDGTWTYAYDGAGRLTHAVFDSAKESIPDQDLAYGYDAMGNRTGTLLNGVAAAYTPNNLNEYTSVGGVARTYDADGNLLSDGADAYTYDVLGRLTSVTAPGGTTTYTYDALGNRASSTTGSQVTRYLNDPTGLADVVGEFDGSGATVAHNTYGLGLTGRVAGGSSYTFDFDAGGSTAGVTDPLGAQVDTYRYSPFGAAVAATGTVPNPFTYGGQYGLADAGDGTYRTPLGGYQPATAEVGSRADRNLEFVSGTVSIFSELGSNVASLSAERFVETAAAFGPDFEAAARLHVLPLERIATGFGVVGLGADLAGFFTPEGPKYFDIGLDVAGLLYEMNPVADALLFDYHFYEYVEEHSSDVISWTIDQIDRHPWLGEALLSIGDVFGQFGDKLRTLTSAIVNAFDPNDMVGPGGFGTPNFVAADATLPYRINFENNPTASAPAHAVTITDQLSPSLDWSTFQITEIGFGDTTLRVPVSSRLSLSTVPMSYNGKSFNVLVQAGIRTGTGQVYVTFQSLDPATGLPPDVLTGFLPAEDGSGRGIGHLGFTVRPKAGLPTGTEIRNVALITFDENDTFSTDQADPFDPSQGVDPTKQVPVTVDAGLPTSTVASLPAVTTTASFTVGWAGSDPPDGSGLGGYDVYVSDNGGAYAPWLTDTADTSATFAGAFGHTYSFYSVATDNAGNRQPTPSGAQATTRLSDPRGVSVAVTSDHSGGSTYGQSVTLTATLTPQLAGNPTPTGTVQFRVDGADFGSPVAAVNGVAQLTTSMLGAGNRGITAAYTCDAGNYDASTSDPYTQVVARATLTVTADDKTKVAGDAIPTLTAGYSGFVNGENASVLSGSPSLTAPGAAVNTAGTYAITAAAGSLAAANYTFQFVNGTLTVTPAAPSAVTATAGTPQSATVGTDFAVPFKAVVKDAYGNPVPGVTVTFTAPASEPTGTFAGGSATADAVTDATGTATAPAFTAGVTAGNYSLAASAGAATPAAFSLTNVGPTVESVVVNGTAAPSATLTTSRITSLKLLFNTPVTADLGAFSLTNGADTISSAAGGAITVTGGGTTTLTLTFTDASGVEFGSLADGIWTLTTDLTKVKTALNVAGSGTATTQNIRRLFGDANGDGFVDGADLGDLGATFGLGEGDDGFNFLLDANGDGFVDGADLGDFGARFGTGL